MGHDAGESLHATGSNPARLGSYNIIRRLARGGMAELFLAESIGPAGFTKLVVLKKILPELTKSTRYLQLFLDEARLAARLDHPHIAHVYDMGTVDGDYFFTMEYVHGQDVRSMSRRASQLQVQMPIGHTVLIASNIAGALHHAHELKSIDGTSLGIVHRDVSPSNILLSYDGTVKLVDFGIAKASNASEKTRTGSLKGKISYMSPEQAAGLSIDRRSDIFSLGIVMWEMVTGARLYKQENDLQTIQKIVSSAPPSPTEWRADCPPELEQIIMRALAKKAEERYQTAEEMQLALEELAREHKMSLSSVALRSQIHALFAPELAAWQEAQGQGTSLAQHAVDHPEMTAALATSDVYSLNDEEADLETEARPHTPIPATLRPDGTPVPVAEWNARFAVAPPAQGQAPPTASVPPPRRRAIVIAIASVAFIILVVVIARRSASTPAVDPIGGQVQTTPDPTVRMPVTPAPPTTEVPPTVVPPALDPPKPAPVVVAQPQKPQKVAPIKKRRPTPKPAATRPPTKPPTKPPPTKPAFDPNEPLPPKQ